MTMEGVVEIAGALERREITAVELAANHLEKIAERNGHLHAFITVTPAQAFAAAEASDARRRAGLALGPLDGVPIAHKDNYATAGVPTTAHSALLREWRPAEDAVLVARLAEAGCVSLGKLACYEFAFAGPGEDLPTPAAVNPWDQTRSTSGSSSGSAVAVAAGLVAAATGSDTGGSIRDPAALNGVTGFKPTYGRLDRTGLLPFAWSLDHPGFLARSVEDCALLMDVATDPVLGHPTDGSAGRAYAAGAPRPLAGVRIGVLAAWHEREQRACDATLNAIRNVGAMLERLGAILSVVEAPPLDDFHAAGWPIALAELHAAHRPWLRAGDGGARYGGLLRAGLAVGASLSAGDYLDACRRRASLRERMAATMVGCDLLLTAVQRGEAPPLAERLGELPFEKPNYTMPFNVTGQPALSLPAGRGAAGLPVAVQLAGRRGEDALVLAAGHAIQRESDWHRRRPPGTGD